MRRWLTNKKTFYSLEQLAWCIFHISHISMLPIDILTYYCCLFLNCVRLAFARQVQPCIYVGSPCTNLPVIPHHLTIERIKTLFLWILLSIWKRVLIITREAVDLPSMFSGNQSSQNSGEQSQSNHFGQCC